ncbi:MAG TPA: hypothetical protein VH477_02490 [Bryobacteraceae bacterium]
MWDGKKIDRGGTVERGNLQYIPVVPGRLEFALHVRRELLAKRPRAIAVQLPVSLEDEYRRATERMPQMSVLLAGEEEEPVYIPVEAGDPFIEALRTAREIEADIIFLEPPIAAPLRRDLLYPSSYSAEMIGIDQYVENYRVHPRVRTQEEEWFAAAMAWKLQGADPLADVSVVISLAALDPLLDAMDRPQDEPARGPVRLFKNAELFNLHPDCLAEVTSEPPYYQNRYNELRETPEEARIDRPRWQLELLREAEAEYTVKTGDQIRSWQRIAMAKFARNLALLDRELMPGAYDLTLAARSLVDDNYAYEVWEMANRYGAQQTEDPPLETLNISGSEIWLRTRRMRIRRRLPRLKQRMKPAGLSRKREGTKGEWARQTTGASICSYPPEDLVIENYGRFLKQHARNMLSEERLRVEPFTASTRDGIDLRETIRNWHEGKLYVREAGQLSADVGALVIIFDEDRADRYRYLTTWLGEHQNESDMAFYSTEPFEHLVGPGVGRAEYGGLMMTLPPGRLYDVWSDYDYETAETKAERLLMAALDYSMERHVVYAAAKPPRSLFRQMAARLNRKIVYIPLGQLSPAKLKKIRVVHVLDSHKRRDEAKQYIW